MVLAIIALLVGIALAVLPTALDAGRRAACASNLRGIGQAMQMYRDENQTRFPVAKYMPEPWLSGLEYPGLNTALREYMDADSQAWRCPGDPVVWETRYVDEDGEERVCGVSYTYISGLSGQRFEETFFARFLQRPPTETPVVHDFDGGTFETESGEQVTAPFFHDVRNILFVDGHVGRLDVSPVQE